jgi:hypothetical protein
MSATSASPRAHALPPTRQSTATLWLRRATATNTRAAGRNCSKLRCVEIVSLGYNRVEAIPNAAVSGTAAAQRRAIRAHRDVSRIFAMRVALACNLSRWE